MSKVDDIPHEESPSASVGGAVAADEGGVLGEGLTTEGFGDWFVIVRKMPGLEACVDCWINVLGTNVFDVTVKLEPVESGKGSDLNTLSKRARLNSAKSAKPLYAGVLSRRVMRAAFCSLCLNCSKFRR
jgi:hypothetical protein